MFSAKYCMLIVSPSRYSSENCQMSKPGFLCFCQSIAICSESSFLSSFLYLCFTKPSHDSFICLHGDLDSTSKVLGTIHISLRISGTTWLGGSLFALIGLGHGSSNSLVHVKLDHFPMYPLND